MVIQIVTLSVEQLQGVITDAVQNGVLMAQKKWAEEQVIVKAEKKFGELLRGAKELHAYLIYKGYWSGNALSSLYKMNYLELAEDRHTYSPVFRKTCIDHAFSTGFRLRRSDKNIRDSSENS